MSDVKVEKENATSQPNNSATELQTSGPSGGDLTQRNAWTPGWLSLNPREFFSASPFELMRRLTGEMDRFFEDFGWSRSKPAFWSPAVEVFERDNQLVVRADLPGLNKDDVKVEMTPDGLVLQGERKHENTAQGEGWYRSERSYGQFYRVIPLPEGTDADQAKANFENGVLEVAIPVPASQRRRRNIPINEPTQPLTQAASAATSK